MSGAAQISVPLETNTSLTTWARRWHIQTQSGLRKRCRELDTGSFVIADLIPSRSLSIVVGDSGLGKSPFLYQAAICVAEGIPFLGHRVTQGRVLYLDFENGLGSVGDLTERLSGHLGQPVSSENLLLWNYNDAPGDWRQERLIEMVEDVKPTWTIIDSLSAFSPDIEEKSSNVTRTYQTFRDIIKQYSGAVTSVHHLRKPSSKPQEAAPALNEDPHSWFLQTRGSRQLINGVDIRIGIDRAGAANFQTELDGKAVEVAFVLAGFGRLRGDIAPMYVGRVLGDDGDALGYRKLSGASLLFNGDQQKAFGKLPASFSFTDAQKCYGRGPQATTDFLQKCKSVGILRKEGRQYKKVTLAESAE